MTSFLKKMMARLKDAINTTQGPHTSKNHDPIDYEGFQIEAAPRQDNGQWLTAGFIRKVINGETKEHHFIRADKHGSETAAADFVIIKAKQIIDQQKETLFNT